MEVSNTLTTKTTSELITEISNELAMKESHVKLVINTFIEKVVANIINKQRVMIPKLGIFSKKRWAERVGNTFGSGSVIIPAQTKVKFSPEKELAKTVDL